MRKTFDNFCESIYKEWQYWVKHRPVGGLIYLITFVVILSTLLYAFFTDSKYTPQMTAVFIALLTFVGIVLTVSYKVKVEVKSKYRQEWINDLRKHMAEYIDVLNSVDRNHQNTSKLMQPLPIDDANTINDSKNKIIALYYYIVLLVSHEARITSDDEITDNFIIMLDLAQASYLDNDQKFKDDFNSKINKIITANDPENTQTYKYEGSPSTFQLVSKQLNICTQKLLKQEWEKVKNGD